jgi:hypothetical protein
MKIISQLLRVLESRRMRRAGHVAQIGEKRNAYRILVGKPEGKRLLGRLRRRWMENMKMDLCSLTVTDCENKLLMELLTAAYC